MSFPVTVLRVVSVTPRPGRARTAVLLGGPGNPTVKPVSDSI